MLKLVCTHEFAAYKRGQEVTDQAEVARLTKDRDMHFVRVAMSEDEIAALAKPAPAEAPSDAPAQ